MSVGYIWSRARYRLARAIYPEGFYSEDASREIDRLIVALENAQQRIRDLERTR
jgi:hypothetical protein